MIFSSIVSLRRDNNAFACCQPKGDKLWDLVTRDFSWLKGELLIQRLHHSFHIGLIRQPVISLSTDISGGAPAGSGKAVNTIMPTVMA